jgi:hypothetical protein
MPHKHLRKIYFITIHACIKEPKSFPLIHLCFYSLCNVFFIKGIADTMAYMQREGCLLRGEHNLLGEAFLVMASAAG